MDLDRGLVRVPATSAKARRDQAVPLPERLIDALRAARPADPLPGATAVPPRAMPNSTTFDADLEAAGIAKADPEGRVVDFHALRHTFVTWLQGSGAHPRVAQALARHASVETTERYTDLRHFDVRGGGREAAAPPQRGAPEARSLRVGAGPCPYGRVDVPAQFSSVRCASAGDRPAADGVHVEEQPEERGVVALVREWRGAGRTLQAIAADLDARRFAPRGGGRWHPQTVANIARAA